MNDDLSHLPELAERTWIPVPDEGWSVPPASAANPAVRFLNGTWDFTVRPRDKARGWRGLDGRWWRWNADAQALQPHEDDEPRGLDADFMAEEPAGVDWQPIAVPGNWEQQAFSQHVFAHASLPLEDVVGYYRRRFDVPGEWTEGGRVILQAEGIAASAEVYVNGRFATYHDGGFVPFQADVTDLLIAGENRIAIRVVKADVSTVHDSSGQWMLSGIWRDIFLFHVGDAHVTDLHVRPDYDAEARAGELTLAVQAAGGATEIQAVLLPWEDGEAVLTGRAAVSGGRAELKLRSAHLAPWTPETPTLYRLECRLMAGGQVVERVREEVGFRRFSADGERFLINGRPFLIRGVTRHEIKQTRGRSLSVADMEEEIRLMRQANVNGVRSHPYPFDPRWVKLCARHGIVVCSGYCLCGYNSWGNPWTLSEVPTYPKHESTFDAGYRELFQNRYWTFAPWIYARYRNHTAVFAWSVSNESALSEIFYPVAKFLNDRERDGGRFILSAGDVNMAESRFEDAAPEQKPLIEHIRRDLLTADSEHYPERRPAEQMPQRLPWLADRPRPTFFTEAAHVYCNRDHFAMDPGILGDVWGRGLRRFFQSLRQVPAAGGYFIFEWSDQSVMQNGEPELDASILGPGRGYKAYVQNIKGIVGGNHELKPSYHSVRKVYAPVIFEHETRAGGDVRLTVRNDYHFRDLAEVRIRCVRTAADGSRAAPQTLQLAAGPGESATAELPALGEGDRYRLEVYDPAWPEAIAEHDILGGQRPWPGQNVRPVRTAWQVRDGQPAGLGGLGEVAFIAPLRPLWGLVDPRSAQRDLGMGHLAAGELPAGVVAPADVQRVEVLDASAGRRVTRHHLGDNGHLDCELIWGVEGEDAVVRQAISRVGPPVWFTGAGLQFQLPGDWDALHWRRWGGEWNEYPDDHPDRLAGSVRLGLSEHPSINPFRSPAWSELPHVRRVRDALLTGTGRPGVWIGADADGQRLAVRCRNDGARDVLLLLECSCNLPWHEFSFFRGQDIRESLLDVHPIRQGEPWRQSWRLALTTSGRGPRPRRGG